MMKILLRGVFCLLVLSATLPAQDNNLQAVLERAAEKQNAGDYDGAIFNYTLALEIDSKDSRTYFSRGAAKAAKGDIDGAIEDFSESVTYNPKERDAYYNRGLAKASKMDFGGAMADFTSTIELAPDDADAYYNRAMARSLKGDLDGAISDYSRVIKINPHDAQAHQSRGNARYGKADLDGAIKDYDKAIELDGANGETYSIRGLAWISKGDFDKAIADCTKGIALNPKLATAYNNRGLAKNGKGDYAAAIADFSQAVEVDPKLEQAYFNRGLAERNLREKTGAAVSGAPVKLMPKGPGALLQDGLEKRARQDQKGAIADFQEGANPDDLQNAYWLFLTRAELGQRDMGARELSALLDLRWKAGPGDWQTQLGYFLLGKITEEKLFALAEASPDSDEQRGRYCEAWFFSGMLKRLAGAREEARSCFRRAVATGRLDAVAYHEAQRALEEAEVGDASREVTIRKGTN